MKNISNNITGIFLLIISVLSLIICIDYIRYYNLPTKTVHIEYSVYSLSGETKYNKDLQMKGNKFHIRESFGPISPETILEGDVMIIRWENTEYKLCSGVDEFVIIDSIGIK